MPSHRLYELSDCSEFRQTLAARPRKVFRVTTLILLLLFGAAVAWAALTEADLVVRAQGRVRPMVKQGRLAESVSEETTVSSGREGRIVKLHVREGDKVRKGDVLVELETERLQNDIAKHHRTITAAEKEIASIDTTKKLMAQRFETAKAKARAELAQVESEIRDAKSRRAAEIKRLSVALETAKQEFAGYERAYKRQAIAESQYLEAQAKVKAAQADLEKASLPVDETKREVLQHALELIDRDYAVELSKLESDRKVKQEKLAATKLELANMNLELRQSVLRAPGDGTVTSLAAKVGDVVRRGQKVLAMVDIAGFRMDVAVATEDVGHLKVGMPVRIKLNAYDYQQYGTVTGRIIFISPDSATPQEAEKSKPPRFLVKIQLDATELGRNGYHGEIKLGMTGSVDIVTDRENLLSLLFRTIRRSISLG